MSSESKMEVVGAKVAEPVDPSTHVGVTVSNHPVLAHKLSVMRSKHESTKEFRRLLREITFYLGYETTAHLRTEPREVETPMAKCMGQRLRDRVALIPLMRAGLGMVDPMLELLPHAVVHHIGMYRDKASLSPLLYYNKLPAEPTCDVAVIMDPVIATAGTLIAAVDIIKEWGVKNIIVMSIVASKDGLTRLLTEHPDIRVNVATASDGLRSDGMVVPGIGDVGDRLFSTFEKRTFPDAVGTKRRRAD